MASVNMPDVQGLNSIAELKNAVAKMTKELSWLLNNLDWKNMNELNIELDGGAYVRINNEGITISDGSAITLKADTAGKVTMTGAVVQSKEDGYPKIVMDPEGDVFGAYSSEGKGVVIGAYRDGEAYLDLVDGPSAASFSYDDLSGLRMASFGDISLNATDIYLYADANVHLHTWYDLRTNTETLQDALDAKANTDEAGYNMTFDNTTRNLKLFSKTGDLLAMVNIPA